MANALLSIQIIPKVDDQDLYSYVDEAIAVIEAANVKYSVHPLETTMEGELSELLQIVKKMNEKMSALGVPSVISKLKLLTGQKGLQWTNSWRNTNEYKCPEKNLETIPCHLIIYRAMGSSDTTFFH